MRGQQAGQDLGQVVRARAMVWGEPSANAPRRTAVDRAKMHGGEAVGDPRAVVLARARLHGAESNSDLPGEVFPSVSRGTLSVEARGEPGPYRKCLPHGDDGDKVYDLCGRYPSDHDSSSSSYTYDDELGFYIDNEFGADSTWMLQKAFRQLQNNVDLVSDYFDEPGVGRSGNCVEKIVNGHLRGSTVKFKLDRVICAMGYTIPGNLHVRLDPDYVRAMYAEYDAASCGADNGECACITAELARTLLHEITHVCGASEVQAYLVDAFYQEKFEERYGYDHCNCCGQLQTFSTWDPSDYDTQADVDVHYQGHGYSNDSGSWRLTDCHAW
jgi:hypothetical protein